METLSNCVRPDQTSNLVNVKCEFDNETDMSRDGISMSKHFQQDHDQLLFFNEYDFLDHVQQPQQHQIEDDRVLATPPPSNMSDVSLGGSSGVSNNNPFSPESKTVQNNCNFQISSSSSSGPCVTTGLSVAVARVAPMAKLSNGLSDHSTDHLHSTDLFGLCGGNAICSQISSNNSTCIMPGTFQTIAANSTTAANGRQVSAKTSTKIVPPKKPLTPYMRFSKMIWQEVKLLNPGMSVCEVGAAIGQMWRNMSDQDKKSYTVDFAVDKARYDDELQSYLSITGLQASDLVSVKQKAKRLGKEKGQGRKSNINTNGSITNSICSNGFNLASNNCCSTLDGSLHSIQPESGIPSSGNNLINCASSTNENVTSPMQAAECSDSVSKVAGVVDLASQMLVIKNLNDDGLRQQLFPNISWSSGMEDSFISNGIETGLSMKNGVSNNLNGIQQHSFTSGNTVLIALNAANCTNNSIGGDSHYNINKANSAMAIIGKNTTQQMNAVVADHPVSGHAGIKLEPYESMNWEDTQNIEALLAAQGCSDVNKKSAIENQRQLVIKTEAPSSINEGVISDQSQQLEWLLAQQQQHHISAAIANVNTLALVQRDINNNSNSSNLGSENNQINSLHGNTSLSQGPQILEPGEVVLPLASHFSNKIDAFSSSDPEKLLLRSALAEKIGELEKLKKELDQAYSIINQLKQQNDFFLQHWNQQQQVKQQQLQLQQLLQQRNLQQQQQGNLSQNQQQPQMQQHLFVQQNSFSQHQHQQIHQQQLRIQQSQQQLLQQLQLQQFHQLCQQQLQQQLQQQSQSNVKGGSTEPEAL